MQDIETAKGIDFADLEKSRSFRMFRQAVKSDKTFYSYRYALREFLKYSNLSSFDEIAMVEPNRLQGILENRIMDLSTKGIKGSTIRVKLAPVELFLDMNRITYFKIILHQFFKACLSSTS